MNKIEKELLERDKQKMRTCLAINNFRRQMEAKEPINNSLEGKYVYWLTQLRIASIKNDIDRYKKCIEQLELYEQKIANNPKYKGEI